MSVDLSARCAVRGDITDEVERSFPTFGQSHLVIILQYKDSSSEFSKHAIRISKARLDISGSFSMYPKPFGASSSGAHSDPSETLDNSTHSGAMEEGMIKLRSNDGDLDLLFDVSDKRGEQEHNEWLAFLGLCISSSICEEAFQLREVSVDGFEVWLGTVWCTTKL